MIVDKWNIPLILKRMIEILLFISPVLIIALPFLFARISQQFVNEYVSGYAQNRWLTLIFIEISSIFCWMVLLMLQKLLKTVIQSSPFVYANVLYLKYISYFCAGVALVLFIKTFVDFSVLTPVVAIISLLASFFCQTLAWVFDKAIRLKDENDLTI